LRIQNKMNSQGNAIHKVFQGRGLSFRRANSHARISAAPMQAVPTRHSRPLVTRDMSKSTWAMPSSISCRRDGANTFCCLSFPRRFASIDQTAYTKSAIPTRHASTSQTVIGRSPGANCSGGPWKKNCSAGTARRMKNIGAMTNSGKTSTQKCRRRVRARVRFSSMCRPKSFTAKTGRCFCVSQIACSSSYCMTGLLVRFLREMSLDPVDAHADVRFAHAERVGDFLVAESVEQQQRHRPVDLAQLRDLLVEPLESRIHPGVADLERRSGVVERVLLV